MKTRQRILFLCLLLTLTLILVLWVSEQGDTEIGEVVVAVSKKIRKPTSTVETSEKSKSIVDLTVMDRESMTVFDFNPFNSKSWYVAPPPPPPRPSPLPSKPTAPALPYSYVGRIEQADGNVTVYLAKGNESFLVRKGDVFDNSYKLEDIQNDNLVIQYLPIPTKHLLYTAGQGT